MDKAIFETAHLAALNDQQRAAVEAVNGPVLLLAVPGSGKTTVLITRLGYMTEVCGIAPEAILTMTYTVAATQEMRARFAARFGGELPHGWSSAPSTVWRRASSRCTAACMAVPRRSSSAMRARPRRCSCGYGRTQTTSTPPRARSRICARPSPTLKICA